ncbi:MAG: dTMP kinase [Bacteroidota bacterium]
MLITFEGIDGSGKSTQARLLRAHAEAEGWRPLLVREPGGTDLSEHVRALLLDPDAHVDARAELLLFAAARAQLVHEVVRPALEDKRLVIADRFYDSTTAYQGAGRGIAEAGWLRSFHAFVTSNLRPRRTYLVDVPLAVASERRGGAGGDRMEEAGTAFFEQVRAAYLRLADAEPERVLRLDGTRPADVLHADIVRDVERLLDEASVGTGERSSG